MGAMVDRQVVNTRRTTNAPVFFKKRYAVPPEKGAWVWLLGPMAVGLAAAATFSLDALAMLVGASAAYMLRQPATLLLRGLGRKNTATETGALAGWCAIYGAIAVASAACLLAQGHLWVIALAVPGSILFLRHLWLVYKNDERHRIGMDIAAAGMLALTAPALLLVHDPGHLMQAAVLWFLLWLQASGSIVHMFLRLEQRRLKTMPAQWARWRRGTLPLVVHLVNVGIALTAAVLGVAPWLVVPAFMLTLVEGVIAVAKPPVRHTPKQLGMRQLAVSSAFFLLVAAGYVV